MAAKWKLSAEARLLDATTPAVLRTSDLEMLATAGLQHPPSRPTLQRWQKDLVVSMKLRPVIKGVFLNRIGHRDVDNAAAAQWIRARSVVSLAWVLEQAGVTNNFGDTVTCVIPIDAGVTTPQISDRKTEAGTFRFFAMPTRLVDERAGALEDIRDLRFEYPRTTAEKALLDWIYLGASTRSRLTRPPMDLQIQSLSMPRLKRLAKAMQITDALEAWLSDYKRHQNSEEVQDNRSKLFNF